MAFPLPISRRRADGFTYIGVLLSLAILLAGLGVVGEAWHNAERREKEAQLLFVGNEYRRAIESHYNFPAAPGRFPRDLGDLVKDPRSPTSVRHIRKLYADPVSGRNEWGIVRSPDGGILGVHSLSEAAPLKTANFLPRDAAFEDKRKYSEWQFVYLPMGQMPVIGKPRAPVGGLQGGGSLAGPKSR
jgi:type II secretory pathway pseudopilin PulG